MPEVLALEDVVTGYGSAPVLHGVSLGVQEGEIAVILGANGAGKTTTLRAAAGLLRPWRGRVVLDGRDVAGTSPERLARAGVGTVPAAPGVFHDLSVLDNLRAGAFALGRDRRRAQRRLDDVLSRFPKLDGRSSQRAGSLSGGEQRLLAVARALMGAPRLLLVDEASMGLSPTAAFAVFELLRSVRDDGVTMCMVEQSPAALDIADRAFLMANGAVVRSAHGDELAGVRDEVADVYLGTAPVGAGAAR